MRILMLLDDAADLEGEVYLEDADGFMVASPRRDITRLVPRFDPGRVQVVIGAVRGTAPDVHSLHARWFDLFLWRRLIRLARELDVELIHALGPRAAWHTAVVGLLSDIPTAASYYDIPIPAGNDWLRRIKRRIEAELLLRGLDRLILPSELAKRLFLHTYTANIKSEVIYPGIDMPDTDLPIPDRAALGLPEGPLVTMIGPLTEDHGHDVFLKALPRLVERAPGVRAAIVGTGPLEEKLRELAGTTLPITWLGNRTDLRDIIAASDVIVSHPRREGVPFALIEASAVGKPMIASRTLGVTEIIPPNVMGLVVTPGDVRDLSVQIGRMLQQTVHAQQLASAAQRHARDFLSLDAQRDMMTMLYESTIYATR